MLFEECAFRENGFQKVFGRSPLRRYGCDRWTWQVLSRTNERGAAKAIAAIAIESVVLDIRFLPWTNDRGTAGGGHVVHRAITVTQEVAV